MAKVSVHQFDRNERIRIARELLDTVANLRSKQEIFEFLFRLLTPSEVLMLARRLQIAKLLIEDASYEEIKEKLHVSHRTTADVDKWLHETDDRIGLVRKRLVKPKNKKVKKHSESMLDKYSYHRLIKEIFD